MKADRQHQETSFRTLQPSKSGGNYIIDNRPQFGYQTKVVRMIQLKTIIKNNNQDFSVNIPTDDSHWTVPSPIVVIKDRIGSLRGPMYNIDPQITKLHPRKSVANQTGVTYGAKHFGGNVAAGLSGTLCRVYRDDVLTGYHFAIPHYHACCKVAGLTEAEARGNAPVNGTNDGMHIHTSQDVDQVQVRLDALGIDVLNAEGETLIDQYPGQIP